MSEEIQAIVKNPYRKALSARNRVFLDKLSDGINVVDAYRLAGYKGNSNHAAYELRRQLKQELRDVLEAKGFTMEGVASEILALSKLPVNPTQIKDGISLNQKIQILKLFSQTLQNQLPKGPTQQNVTAFIVNRGSDKRALVHIDTEVTDENKH
jgi:hypothetical protein